MERSAAGEMPALLSLLATMYLTPPSPSGLEEWGRQLSEVRHPAVAPLSTALAATSCSTDELQTEYARLFVGPAALPCPPWESVYTSPHRQMMQRAHDDVRRLYGEAGWTVAGRAALPDHIGVELGFLALLIDRAGRAESGESRRLLGLADRLLDDHVNRWVFRFTEDLERSASLNLYRQLARTTREVLKAIQE